MGMVQEGEERKRWIRGRKEHSVLEQLQSDGS